jgi:peptidoglycan-associated lipoprotein
MKSVTGCVLGVFVCGILLLGAGGCRSTTGAEEGLVGDVLDPMGITDDQFAMASRGDGLPGNPVTDVSFERVAFLYDSFQIADSERGKIETVGNYMNRNADVTAYIDGHCDERGSREYNLSLSEHRALAIRAYLISLGVGGDRILTRSFGEEQPLDLGHSNSAWSQNRRGEFSLYR